MAILTKDTEEGYEVSGSLKTVTSYRMWLHSGGWPRFTGWPAKNIHTDLEVAKRAGLPTRIASGTMSLGYLTELMIDLFGETWFRGGKMSYKFIRPVVMGNTVVTKARVQSKRVENSRIRFVLEVWCENQHGDKTTIGTATCLIQ